LPRAGGFVLYYVHDYTENQGNTQKLSYQFAIQSVKMIKVKHIVHHISRYDAHYSEEGIPIELSERQKKILAIVEAEQPITSSDIALRLGLNRSTLRGDLGILSLSGNLIAKPKVGYCINGTQPQEAFGRQVREMLVGEVKSLPVVVDEKDSVYDALVALFLDDASTVFVRSDGFLAGLASRKDFLKAAIGGQDLQKIPIGVIMTRMPNIVVTHPQESVLEAARRIVHHQVDSLPVVETHERNGEPAYKIVGVISKTNLARLFVELSK